jgi:hypothetical protein
MVKIKLSLRLTTMPEWLGRGGGGEGGKVDALLISTIDTGEVENAVKLKFTVKRVHLIVK